MYRLYTTEARHNFTLTKHSLTTLTAHILAPLQAQYLKTVSLAAHTVKHGLQWGRTSRKPDTAEIPTCLSKACRRAASTPAQSPPASQVRLGRSHAERDWFSRRAHAGSGDLEITERQQRPCVLWQLCDWFKPAMPGNP